MMNLILTLQTETRCDSRKRRFAEEGKVPVLRYDDYKDFNFDIETWKEIADNINNKNEKGKN